ncbi:cadherin-related family member 2 [Rhinichthys klamathensis goyatoka]|uniref:cadherin-related family member 2 n=1 Tax=Rhinichthys klamathensis goyatoka TaxID=3034132 RepID=UPI0024B544D0|nr:cadherin-related family member 2 [Rhinichthys klamathensis goyatoka]
MGRMGTPLLLLFSFLASGYCNSVPVINMALVNLREDLKVGDFAFQIIASDPDNDPLTYGIRGTDASYFEVNRATGEVKIKSQLDRESKDLLLIDAVVNDGVYADVTKSVYIPVDDANDNAPVFNGLPYNVEVQENVATGSQLFRASATDIDFGQASVVYYKIDEVVPNEGAILFSISATNGIVVLEGTLNYTEKSPFYQIRINASDGGGLLHGEEVVQSTAAFAFITVKDVADINPQFLNLPNFAAIDENSDVGTSVFTVKARDPDTGVNDVIRYSIEKTNAPDLFQITETGEISVKTKFDREELLDIDTTVVLHINARETHPNVDGVIASTVSDLQISIGDINDNGPEFYECESETCTQKNSFTGKVDEHSSVGLAVNDLNIRVKDPDQGQNSRFILELAGPDKDAFLVSPSSGLGDSFVQVTIKDPDEVDFEKKTVMYVQIIAKDASADFTSTASVTININDKNDNFPSFEEEVYNADVNEHCEDGTFVATITATDADALDDGKITYRLIPESIRSLFDVYENNGTIYVKNGGRLDWEGTNSYSPTLQALDSNGNIGSIVVMIDIMDINDQKPEMNREVYEAYVKENNNLELQIKAIDGDKPNTLNSKIQYHIKDSFFSSNFTIDPDTGLLKNDGQLDLEAMDPLLKGVIELTVLASDMGTPSLSSSANVTINIEDVNDNSPQYLDPAPKPFHVKESEGGILVGSLLARDADQTDLNNRIIFSITDGSFGSFILFSEPLSEGYRGNITVDPAVELDYESDRKTFNLKVEASDLGQRKATIEVQVIVDDVNDTPPVFPSGMTLNVNENSKLPETLKTIEGTDVDTKHLLEYELISTECQCNGTRGPCPEEWFKVERNGDVKAISSYDIDYEKCDKVFLTAMVEDLLTEKGKNSTEGIVTVNIVDINDNAPEFIASQEFYVVVIEKVEQGTSVARVYAKDRDTDEKNRKTNFKVTRVDFIGSEGNSSEMFLSADSPAQEDAEGIFTTHIRSQKSMDNNKKGKFVVEVQAFNPDGLNSTSVVELLTVDSSYRVSLRFNAPVSEVNENLGKIRNILTSATKATVEFFNVLSESRAQRAEETTVLEAYFVFRNGTALDYDAVTSILNSEEVYREFGYQLTELGFTGISTTITESGGVKTEVFIMIGLMAALAIVLVVTTTSLVCIRRSYKRKLKAAKAMNSAATVVIQNQKTGPVVPGTNKYTKEGANPVLNMNIDTATDLGFDEDGSSPDRESLNSLDYNIDMTMAEKDTMPMMVIEEEEEEEEDDNRSDSSYIEPLGAALAQREKKRRADSPGLTFTNPSINTTDL